MKRKRINVIGPSASRKTSVANRLSDIFNLKHHRTDSILFTFFSNTRKLKKISEKELTAKVEDIIRDNSWILEGKYLSEEVFKKADLIVWVHDNLFNCLRNQWVRFINRKEQRQKYGLANNIRLSVKIVRQHLELYTSEELRSPKKYTYRKTKDLLKNYNGKVVKIRKERDVDSLIEALTEL